MNDADRLRTRSILFITLILLSNKDRSKLDSTDAFLSGSDKMEVRVHLAEDSMGHDEECVLRIVKIICSNER